MKKKTHKINYENRKHFKKIIKSFELYNIY